MIGGKKTSTMHLSVKSKLEILIMGIERNTPYSSLPKCYENPNITNSMCVNMTPCEIHTDVFDIFLVVSAPLVAAWYVTRYSSLMTRFYLFAWMCAIVPFLAVSTSEAMHCPSFGIQHIYMSFFGIGGDKFGKAAFDRMMRDLIVFCWQFHTYFWRAMGTSVALTALWRFVARSRKIGTASGIIAPSSSNPVNVGSINVKGVSYVGGSFTFNNVRDVSDSDSDDDDCVGLSDLRKH
jgi:hypothetical protein